MIEGQTVMEIVCQGCESHCHCKILESSGTDFTYETDYNQETFDPFKYSHNSVLRKLQGKGIKFFVEFCKECKRYKGVTDV